MSDCLCPVSDDKQSSDISGAGLGRFRQYTAKGGPGDGGRNPGGRGGV